MKLKNLDSVVTNFAGVEIHTPDGPNKEPIPLTIKVVLLNMLGSMETETGKEAIHVSKLGPELYKCAGDFGVSREDMDLLEKAVNQNKPQYLGYIKGQILAYLSEVDKS